VVGERLLHYSKKKSKIRKTTHAVSEKEKLPMQFQRKKLWKNKKHERAKIEEKSVIEP